MNIILAEERAAGPQPPERTFSQPIITIGRDPVESDIAFDGAHYPMVSRKHAELRWHDNRWLVIDLNSSYGTYLDGQRVSVPQALAAASRLQIGVDGPVLRVVWFEVTSEQAEPENQGLPPIPPAPRVNPAKAPLPVPAVKAYLIRSDNDANTRSPITKPLIWLGRDPSCEMVFDAASATISRRHASIRQEGGVYVITDNQSFNGTFVNGQRINADVPLYHGDEIQLGLGGPILSFSCPDRPAPAAAGLAAQRDASSSSIDVSSQAGAAPKTVVLKLDRTPAKPGSGGDTSPQLLISAAFDQRGVLTIGRGESNDIRLDGLQISKSHAKLIRKGPETVIEDLGSTNGVFVNGARVDRRPVGPNDDIQIGSFLLKVDGGANVGVFDTRSKTRVDCMNLTRDVRGPFSGAKFRLLDDISLSIQPNEFIGLLGPSGAGKSSLIEALNGVRPANSGHVRINNLDLYKHFDSLKQAIGYVPQDDIIHRELSVFRTLYYVARLRLPRDVSKAEILRIIEEVLDVTGLAERRNVPVSQLSGGQRKRVSIAVELVTKPSVIFLDEPTSGLDPATEDKIMQLFRQIADSGRTVVMTTHAMENVRLFDKIVVLMNGKMVFFGTPDDALKHLGSKSFKDLYDRLEAPVDAPAAGTGKALRSESEAAAENWKNKYRTTPQYRELVEKPLSELGALQQSGIGKKRRLGIFGAVRQWLTLSRRYLEVLFKDKTNLAVLLLQAPVIALLTFAVMGAEQPRDFVYFVLALVAIWFGLSISAREIIRERAIYRRERMFNLGILPYVLSKLFILGLIVFLQCAFVFIPLKFFDLVGLMAMPGELAGIPQFWTMLVTAGVGIVLGLFISAVFRTQEIAASLVPLILIPQILFSGLVGVPAGVNKVIGLTMPAAWSFDTMKRFSTLETLEPEGADPRDGTKGLGLYKFTEAENDRTLEKAERDIEDYKQLSGGQPAVDEQGNPTGLSERLKVPEIKKIPADLSPYVTFLHPWMNEVLNQVVLMLMFGILLILTLIVMRLKDIR